MRMFTYCCVILSSLRANKQEDKAGPAKIINGNSTTGR